MATTATVASMAPQPRRHDRLRDRPQIWPSEGEVETARKRRPGEGWDFSARPRDPAGDGDGRTVNSVPRPSPSPGRASGATRPLPAGEVRLYPAVPSPIGA